MLIHNQRTQTQFSTKLFPDWIKCWMKMMPKYSCMSTDSEDVVFQIMKCNFHTFEASSLLIVFTTVKCKNAKTLGLKVGAEKCDFS